MMTACFQGLSSTAKFIRSQTIIQIQTQPNLSICTEAPPDLENSTPALEKARSDWPRENRIGVLLPSLSLSLLPHETGIKEEFSWESVCLLPVTLDLESRHSGGFWCIGVGG